MDEVKMVILFLLIGSAHHVKSSEQNTFGIGAIINGVKIAMHSDSTYRLMGNLINAFLNFNEIIEEQRKGFLMYTNRSSDIETDVTPINLFPNKNMVTKEPMVKFTPKSNHGLPVFEPAPKFEVKTEKNIPSSKLNLHNLLNLIPPMDPIGGKSLDKKSDKNIPPEDDTILLNLLKR